MVGIEQAPLDITYTLGEIDVDAMVVNQHALHFKVGLLAVLLMLKLDECVLQTVARALVPNHLTGQDRSETTEDQLKVLIYFAWQLA
jgi:hypothetical protein